MNTAKLKRVSQKSLLTTTRVYLGIIFLIYGAAKIHPGQFHHGDFVFDSTKDTPFELVWYFFGYSLVYTLFIALGEIVAAILLIIPRTATLGAVCLLPISVNIAVINFCYDVKGMGPFTLFLSVLCLWLLFMDRKKLQIIFWDRHSVESFTKKPRRSTVANTLGGPTTVSGSESTTRGGKNR
ncbi:hypothetical protein [Paludifilum halophilum]|uniref:hypothetical protein n=1 Tax=Paludifilum halophilum TaxID=1642702 RepID=UPI001980ADE7|nr:hypothetical protein [Paludifilum halophilum]